MSETCVHSNENEKYPDKRRQWKIQEEDEIIGGDAWDGRRDVTRSINGKISF